MIVQAVGGIRVVVTLKDHRLDLEAMARAITPMTKMVFIPNPNNPTSTIVTASEVEHFMARLPDHAIVVFDEAYVEFAQGPDFPDALGYVQQGRRAAVLRTFSKAASLAGLRVGYCVADPNCVALVNRIRAPFNVNSLGQAAALAALADRPWQAALASVVAATATGRLAVSWACRRGVPAARPEGLGAAVAGTVGPVALLVGTAAVGLLATPAVPGRPWQGPVAVLGALAVVLLLLRHVVRRLGGITGDVLGACVETAVTLAYLGLVLDPAS
jgi:hypothetical protein